MSTPGYLRIGDAERDYAIELLQRHFADGRLTQEEYEERVAAALKARTQADIAALFRDLPLLPSAAPLVRRKRRPGAWMVPVLVAAVVCLIVAAAVNWHLFPLFFFVFGVFVLRGVHRSNHSNHGRGGWPPHGDRTWNR
ncbi:MAG: DUF1707 domain-containing protein [Acidothermus sp.]|nr:DUF1707 domain-containing protein [Acidothermus sp.]MCL6537552.1 DUF1707 domain-containing protein [Acidothermus sp.]